MCSCLAPSGVAFFLGGGGEGGWFCRLAGLWRPADKRKRNGRFYGSSCRFLRTLGTGHESVVVCYSRKKQDLFPGLVALPGGFGSLCWRT